MIAIFITIVLLFLALIHVYWGFGGNLPGQTEQELTDMVVGVGTKMPGFFPCLLVTIILSLLSYTVAVSVWEFPWPFNINILNWITGISSVVFFIRGTVSWLPVVSKKRNKKFVALDHKIYSPLCLLLAGGLAYISL